MKNPWMAWRTNRKIFSTPSRNRSGRVIAGQKFGQLDDITHALDKIADERPDFHPDEVTPGELKHTISKFFRLIGTMRQRLDTILNAPRNMATVVEAVFEARPDPPSDGGDVLAF